MRCCRTTRCCTACTSRTPTPEILPERIAVQPYGMPIAKGHPEFVRFVNALLERMRDDGSLAALDEKWLGRIRPSPPVPPARYRD